MRMKTLVVAITLIAACLMAGTPAALAAKDYIYVPVSNSLHVIDCESDTHHAGGDSKTAGDGGDRQGT